MNILKEIFGDFSTFSRYAPGVETNMNLDDLQSSGRRGYHRSVRAACHHE